LATLRWPDLRLRFAICLKGLIASHALPDEAMAGYVASFGIGFANAILEEMATGKARTQGMMARAKLLSEGIGPEMAARIHRGLPREPLMIQAITPSESSPMAIATLTRPPKPKKSGRAVAEEIGKSTGPLGRTRK
jgi:hypothetical protein